MAAASENEPCCATVGFSCVLHSGFAKVGAVLPLSQRLGNTGNPRRDTELAGLSAVRMNVSSGGKADAGYRVEALAMHISRT